MISWDVTKSEYKTIQQIADRAATIALTHDSEYPAIDAQMDIVATHANGNPLKLRQLLQADEFNFCHDVFGIRRHLNRETGRLENSFLPRFTEAK